MNGWIKKTCNTCLIILSIGMGAALLSLTSFGAHLEEEYGLPWLFKMRGHASAPEDVIIVSIDKKSAKSLHLPDDPGKWPRSYYAELIEKLNQQKPAVIAINITFDEERDLKNDAFFAAKIGQGKNIILSNYLKRDTIPATNSNNTIEYERLINPIPILDLASLGAAPFPLPRTSQSIKQFWTYTHFEEGIATFPVAIFQYFVFKQAYPEIVYLLEQVDPTFELPELTSFEQPLPDFNATNSIKKIQARIVNELTTIQQLDLLINQARFSKQKKRLLQSWLTLLQSPDSLFFNHYGSAGKITSIPFYQVLASDTLNPDLFKNKVVLIGYSEDIEPEKNQGIYTVYSETFTTTTSPIEIAATAVANLIDNNWLKPLQPWDQFTLLFSWGIVLCLSYRLLPYRLSIISLFVLTLSYVAIAYFKFANEHVWLPFFIPIMIQAPLVLLASSTACFLKTTKEHQNVHEAFSQFLPGEVVVKFSHRPNASSLDQYGEVMQGLCMATDAEQYTMLSETMDPQELNQLMNAYYGAMFPQVKKYKGIISDVIGDAMLAIWAKPEKETQIRYNACHAALEIIKAVDMFNSSQPYQLPTRLGLHYGKLRLGNVGAQGHYEYRALGDTVNTSTRIEGLNKLFGTKILVSSKVISGLSGFHSRELGYFLLKGKKNPVKIYELISSINQQPDYTPELMSSFSNALKLFQNFQWEEALELWLTLQHAFPDDGATFFYINYLSQKPSPLSAQHNSNLPAVIDIGNITIPVEL